MMVVALLLLRCGFAPVEEAPAPGPVDAGPAVVWCAGESAACWADGWSYETPGRCCLSRQTCKGLDRAAGVMGYCEY